MVYPGDERAIIRAGFAYEGIAQEEESHRISGQENRDSWPLLSTLATETKKLSPGLSPRVWAEITSSSPG